MAKNQTKRISILPTNEIDDLFARPIFNDDERLIWFELDQEMLKIIGFKSSLASKIDFILQLGYFKSKHQFFTFTLNDVHEDVSYIINRYFPDKILIKSTLGRAARYLNQKYILENTGFTVFNRKIHITILLAKASDLSRTSNDPLFLFRGLFDYLNLNKITIPGYSTFQEHLISVVIAHENNRLYGVIKSEMTFSERESILTLLEEGDSFYTITCLKQQPKNFKLTAIRKEVELFEKLLAFYQIASRILPKFNLSKNAINYYSSLVDHYTVQGLSRINIDQTSLWLICFVYKRYRTMLDNLTTMLIYVSSKYQTAVDERAKALLIEELLKPNDQNWTIAKALYMYNDPETDDTQAFNLIKKQVHNFLPPEKIDQIVKDLSNDKTTKQSFQDQFVWVAVDELAATYKQPLRLLIMALSLNGQQYVALQEAHKFLKDALNNKMLLSKIEFSKFPLNFIASKNIKFICDNQKKTIHISRYEYECYHRIAEAINKSALFVTDSTRYNSLKDELITNWQDKKITIIKNLNNNFLNQSMSHFIETHVKPLDQDIRDINEDIANGNNPFVKVKIGKDAYKQYDYRSMLVDENQESLGLNEFGFKIREQNIEGTKELLCFAEGKKDPLIIKVKLEENSHGIAQTAYDKLLKQVTASAEIELTPKEKRQIFDFTLFNKHIHLNGPRDWTLPYTRKNEKITNPFYSKLPNISINHLLQMVNDQTGFINEFTHIKPHYAKSKIDEISIFAALVANGTNLGVDRMAMLCDLNFNDLNNADKNYIRLSTLRAANDRVSNAISKLPIFRCWNLMDDLLLASADGQKMLTERDIILARLALKYFGLEKGVVSHSLIANHVPINCLLIGANMHESHYLFDLLYNNTSLIIPDMLATDTEGSNQLNFLLLNIIEKLYVPRYRDLSSKTETIISFGDHKQFDNYLIKPQRSFNEKLVLDEEDNIKHIIASLLSGEANQSNIVRKLSSEGHASRTKQALWEMNNALMTKHLLLTISDVNFRQAIQAGLCRGEAYHQLRRAIEKANGRNFRATSDIQIATWNECARLITNNVIFFNAVILNALKEESDTRGDTENSKMLIRLSPAAWTHINFQGRYVFLENNGDFDLKNIIKSLSDIKVV